MDDKEYNVPNIEIELKEITRYVYESLNYNITDYNLRKEIVDDIQFTIGEELNAHLYFCMESNLNNNKIATAQQYIDNLYELMTEYLLNSNDVKKNTEYNYYSPDKLKDGSSKKSISLESYMSDILSIDGNIYKHYDDNNNATYKIADFADEIKDVEFINDYAEFNKIARKVIETGKLGDKEFNLKELSVLKRAIGYRKNNSIEIDKDIITLYKMYKGFIYFKQPLKETTEPSYEYFDFDDINQIMALLKFKSEGNFDTDIGCLLYYLNCIIKNTKLTKVERNILNCYRSSDISLEDIAKEFKVSRQYIGDRLLNICKKISEQYWLDYEDWYYTYIVKGKYKKCSCCGQIKLANENYFGINKRNKDGLSNVCKECRNKKQQKLFKKV
jgi:hypothetical protein